MERVRLVTFRGTEDQVKQQEALSRPFGILNKGAIQPRACEVEIEDCSSIDLDGKEAFIFNYENWEGKIGIRKVIPLYCKFEVNEFHGDKPLWLLKAYDLDKLAIRYFDMTKINT